MGPPSDSMFLLIIESGGICFFPYVFESTRHAIQKSGTEKEP